ncbi:AfsR/SARP family transcriptional regulator [Streptomyces sp. NPDC001668]|uniref:AfsR/SARP family transcriptional regulator n=1 Tax=unclassified Streptomyces TaxID=2593676 RepID=UPI0033C70C36
MEDDLRFRLLGPVEAQWQERLLPLGGIKQRTALAVFLLQPSTVIRLDEVVQAVWGPDASSSLRNAAQAHISRIRRSLARCPGAELRTRSAGYVLEIDPDCVDLHRFRHLVTRARAVGSPALYREALHLWRGHPLANTESKWLLEQAATGLEEEYLVAVDGWAETELRAGNHHIVLTVLPKLAKEHCLRESFHELLITALCQAGRQAEALLAYQEIRRRLATELGVEPGARLQRLFAEALHSGDPLAVISSASHAPCRT